VIVGAALALACVDMSAPKGPAAISNLRLPSPSVVVGDVMRDSNGTPAALTITAFDAAGTPTTAQGAQFFITDSTKAAHLAGGTMLTGDKIGSTVLVGQIGNLQTAAVTVQVTYLPSKMLHTGTDSTLTAPLSRDTAIVGIATLTLRVSSAQDSASAGIVVRYALTRAPAALDPAHPAVFIADNTNRLATADTTTEQGTSTRHLVVISARLSDQALVAGTKTDTAIVEARASYKGAPLDGSPVRFVIPIRVALK
jgi:hypothetical protein